MVTDDEGRKFDMLIEDVCALGFCGSFPDGGEPSHISDFLPKTGSISADDFAAWVLRAEGMVQDEYPEFRRSLRNAFVDRMGCRSVDVETIASSLWITR